MLNNIAMGFKQIGECMIKMTVGQKFIKLNMFKMKRFKRKKRKQVGIQLQHKGVKRRKQVGIK